VNIAIFISMISWWHQFLAWIHARVAGYIHRNVVLQETWELERMSTRGVALPYVLLENKSLIFNHFLLPISLLKVRLQIWNKQVMVGRVIFDGPVKIPPGKQKTVVMEVRLSHITAIFNVLRFLLTDTILMEIKGQIEIKVLWMVFQIPVDEAMSVPRSKFTMALDEAGLESTERQLAQTKAAPPTNQAHQSNN
jgi:hypothetical protein